MLTGLCSVCYQDQIYYCKIKLPHTFLGHKFCHHLKQKDTCSIFGMSHNTNNAQKMKFSIKNFFSKWDQIRSFRWIWSHLLNKSVMENFIFCAVKYLHFFCLVNLVLNICSLNLNYQKRIKNTNKRMS